MKKLPDDFSTYTRGIMGDDRYSRFLDSFDDEPPVSIRLNLRKLNVEDGILNYCAPQGDQTMRSNSIFNLQSSIQQVPWCSDGVYLKQRPQFTFDPLLHAGCYYVQEASSMFIDRVLRQHVDKPVTMLDLCAAPGGKSTAALAALPEGSLLVSNEPVRTRANILAENITKWGAGNVIVTNGYPKEIASSGVAFDVVLCDVPCSGEGMFRKDEGAIDEWSVANVEKCWRLQREIVSEAWKMLKAGGILIYSTCTFNLRENEMNVKWIIDELQAEPLSIAVDDEWDITSSLLDGFTAPVYRFIPGITRGEGLFMAAVRKGEAPSCSPKGESCRRKKQASRLRVDLPLVGDGWQQISCGDKILSLPKELVPIYEALSAQRVRIVKAGVAIGTVKGKDLVPDIELALSTQLAAESYPRFEADLDMALAYLRKEAIVLPTDVPKGYVLVTYQHQPLGFVKNLGNRANNLYPQEWKIRSRQ
ncbi:MAG: hypothetical protein ACI4B3_06990 [Prevotella sp.]